MTRENFDKAKEIVAITSAVVNLEHIFGNLYADKNHNNLRLVKTGNEYIINSCDTALIPQELRDKILNIIMDYEDDLNKQFESL